MNESIRETFTIAPALVYFWKEAARRAFPQYFLAFFQNKGFAGRKENYKDVLYLSDECFKNRDLIEFRR